MGAVSYQIRVIHGLSGVGAHHAAPLPRLEQESCSSEYATLRWQRGEPLPRLAQGGSTEAQTGPLQTNLVSVGVEA